MAQSTQVQREGVAQVAGRILIAWRNGESADLIQELEHARCLAAQTAVSSTLEMETEWKLLSGAVESLGTSGGNTPALFGYWNTWQSERPERN